MGNSWGLKVTLSLPIPFLFDTTDLFTNFLSVWYFREAGFKHIYPFKFLIILCIVYFILIIICILQYFISFCNSKPFLYIKKKNSWVLLSVATFAVSDRYGFYHLPIIKNSQVLHDCQKSKRTYSEGLYRIVILKNVTYYQS